MHRLGLMSTEWFKNAVIYQILIDRFAGYKSGKWYESVFLGGNIRGIIEKLDYIEALGVNTIWISPFYETNEYHGYHITDFFKVDRHFGSENDLKELVHKVHKADMKIIADFVPNHCFYKHPYFLDAQNNKDSVYKEWFYFNKWPDDYLRFLNYEELPKLNLDNEEACRHIINAAKYWLSLEIDGYRLDHCIGPKHEFWKIFRNEIKGNCPDCVLIGEAYLFGVGFKELKTINIRNKYLNLFKREVLDGLFKQYIGELDGVLDFKFQQIIQDFAVDKITREKALKKLQAHYRKFPPDFYLPTFLDNHDMDRFLYTCRHNKGLLKEAVKIQFSINQPKIIYYGTEVGMSQKKSIRESDKHGDLQARQPMMWKKQDKNLLKFYMDTIHINL